MNFVFVRPRQRHTHASTPAVRADDPAWASCFSRCWIRLCHCFLSFPKTSSGGKEHPALDVRSRFNILRMNIASPMPSDDGLGLHDRQGRLSVRPKPGGQHPEEPVAGPEFRTFDGMLIHGHLLAECKILESYGSAANDERPEKQKDSSKNAHDSVLLHSANGQSYWNVSLRANGWRRILPRRPQNSQIRIFPGLRNRLC